MAHIFARQSGIDYHHHVWKDFGRSAGGGFMYVGSSHRVPGSHHGPAGGSGFGYRAVKHHIL